MATGGPSRLIQRDRGSRRRELFDNHALTQLAAIGIEFFPRIDCSFCQGICCWTVPTSRAATPPPSQVVCTSPSAKKLFPAICPMSYTAAVEAAAERPVPDESFQRIVPENAIHACVRHEGLICDTRQVAVNAPAEQVFAVLRNLGGERGWPYANLLWQLRG